MPPGRQCDAGASCLLTHLPGRGSPHLPGLGLPWVAPEAIVRDWGFMGSPGAAWLPALGTWM